MMLYQASLDLSRGLVRVSSLALHPADSLPVSPNFRYLPPVIWVSPVATSVLRPPASLHTMLLSAVRPLRRKRASRASPTDWIGGLLADLDALPPSPQDEEPIHSVLQRAQALGDYCYLNMIALKLC